MNKTILLVEDDLALSSMMKVFLNDEGYDVEVIDDGLLASNKIQEGFRPDLLVLDIMLPGKSGVEICSIARQHLDCPILMLTAQDDDFSEINSLRHGADTYLTKPISPHVFLEHIKSLFRRNSKINNFIEPAKTENLLCIQDVSVDLFSMKVSVGGLQLDLPVSEFDLLTYFLQNAGRIVSREELFQELRGIDYDGLDRTIDMRISVLRKKMNDEKPPFKYIKTIRSKGYLFAIK